MEIKYKTIVYYVYYLISAFIPKGLRTMFRTCLDGPDDCHGGTLAGLALRNPKVGPPVV
jgi:hypothetical protein